MELLPAYQGFLDLCKASAALHQQQRIQDGHGRIIAEGKDYDQAIDVLECVQFGKDSADHLRGAEQKLYSLLMEQRRPMTLSALAIRYGSTRENLVPVIRRLREQGLAVCTGEIKTGGKRPDLWKSATSVWRKPELPDFDELTAQKA